MRLSVFTVLFVSSLFRFSGLLNQLKFDVVTFCGRPACIRSMVAAEAFIAEFRPFNNIPAFINDSERYKIRFLLHTIHGYCVLRFKMRFQGGYSVVEVNPIVLPFIALSTALDASLLLSCFSVHLLLSPGFLFPWGSSRAYSFVNLQSVNPWFCVLLSF